MGDSIFDVLKEGGLVAKETFEATFAEKVTAGTANHGGPAYRQAGTAGISKVTGYGTQFNTLINNQALRLKR